MSEERDQALGDLDAARAEIEELRRDLEHAGLRIARLESAKPGDRVRVRRNTNGKPKQPTGASGKESSK